MRIAAGIALIAVLPRCTTEDPVQVQDPVPGQQTPAAEAFGTLDGTWRGSFVGYDPTGRELYRIAVRQVYRTVDAHVQEVTIEDTMPDGEVIRGRGRNVARRGTDGSLVLECTVEKSTGETVRHQGKLVTGPTGRTELVWYWVGDDRTETFREWVEARGDAGGEAYVIHGMGRYGDQLMLMAGDYRRVP